MGMEEWRKRIHVAEPNIVGTRLWFWYLIYLKSIIEIFLRRVWHLSFPDEGSFHTSKATNNQYIITIWNIILIVTMKWQMANHNIKQGMGAMWLNNSSIQHWDSSWLELIFIVINNYGNSMDKIPKIIKQLWLNCHTF